MTAVARWEDHELLARVIDGLTHQIAELVQTVRLADQREAVVLGLHFVSRGALNQFIQ